MASSSTGYYRALGIQVSSLIDGDNSCSPLRSFSLPPTSILAEWLPNCIALFFLLLASNKPIFLAASLNSILSPKPNSSLGSTFICTGKSARKETTERARNGCRVSLPCEEMIRSSRPRLRVGIRSNSSWSCEVSAFHNKLIRISSPRLWPPATLPGWILSGGAHIPQAARQILNRSKAPSQCLYMAQNVHHICCRFGRFLAKRNIMPLRDSVLESATIHANWDYLLQDPWQFYRDTWSPL